MRANLPTKEPKILEEWDKEKIFYKLKKLRRKSLLTILTMVVF